MADQKDTDELRSPFIYKDDEALEKPFQFDQLRRLLGYMREFPRLIVGALLTTIGGILVALATPYLIGRAIDTAISKAHLNLLITYASILFVLYIVNFFSTRYRIHFTNTLGQSVILRLRRQLFSHVQQLSFDFFDQRPAGSVLVRIMNDVDSLNDLFSNGVINTITNLFTLIGIIIIMIGLNWKLALVTFVVIPFMALISTRLTVRIRRGWQQVRLRSSKMNAHLAESIQGIRVTEAYTRQAENLVFFKLLNGDYVKTFLVAVNRSAMFGPLVDVTGAIGTALLFWYGVHLLSLGEVTVGLLVAFANYLGNFWTPIAQLGQVYNQLLVAMASSERIFQYLDTRPSIEDGAKVEALPPIEGRVTFDHVSFEYKKGEKALNNVSFTAEPGQSIALVGHTGAGKSTVMNLLARFYERTEGCISIDGFDIQKVSLQSLRSQIGVVLQDTFIFSGTIMENIRYGRPDATDEEVIAAAKTVHADDFIRDLENGYETEVRERGSRLSMGQRQLLSFARAILANPKILILDEATASIDTHTEHLIQLGLQRLLAGRTSFIVAHRLSTIRQADQILVFDHGQIVERGNHDSLMKVGGYYYDLVSAQYRFLA